MRNSQLEKGAMAGNSQGGLGGKGLVHSSSHPPRGLTSSHSPDLTYLLRKALCCRQLCGFLVAAVMQRQPPAGIASLGQLIPHLANLMHDAGGGEDTDLVTEQLRK